MYDKILHRDSRDYFLWFAYRLFYEDFSPLDPQAVLFGRWNVGGVGVRGCLTNRHTSPGWVGESVCYVTVPLTPTPQNSNLPNNTACGNISIASILTGVTYV